MKRRLVYVLLLFLILLIVLGIWLFNHAQQGEDTTEKIREEYLAPIYDVNVHRDVIYANKKNESETRQPLKLDVYQPASNGNQLRPVFIFIHGGGYTGGSKQDGAAISTAMAKRGYVVVSMDYRLKKEPFANFARTLSDAYEDISDVIRWINDNAETYGLDTARVVIGGDSAGGYLSMNFTNTYLQRDPSIVKSIFAIVDIYGGPIDNGIQATLPPVLIVHGTIDQLIPYQQSLKLNDMLQKRGIYRNLLTMEGVGHDYKNEKYIDEVIEMTAHFLWNVMHCPGDEWLPENSGVTVAAGDSFDISLPEAYSPKPANGELRVSLPKGWSLDRNVGDRVLRVQVPADMHRGNDSVVVSLDQGQETAPGFAVHVHVIDPLAVSFETYFDARDDMIKTHMRVNNRSQNKFSGSLVADYETEQSTQGTFTASAVQLNPGESALFDIPELARGKRTMKGYNDLGVLMQDTEDTFHALLIHEPRKPIQMDGSLEDWQDQASFDVNEVKMDGWRGAEDTSAIGYLSWDGNHLYLALEVTDDNHVQSATGGDIWSGDSVQMAIGIANADGSIPLEYHEIGTARDNRGSLSNWRWLAPRGFHVNAPVPLDYAIRREESKTVYEIAIPWSELTHDADRVKRGMKMKFSLLVNDDDGDGRKGWLEYNSGIGTAKDIHAFGDVYLID